MLDAAGLKIVCFPLFRAAIVCMRCDATALCCSHAHSKSRPLGGLFSIVNVAAASTSCHTQCHSVQLSCMTCYADCQAFTFRLAQLKTIGGQTSRLSNPIGSPHCHSTVLAFRRSYWLTLPSVTSDAVADFPGALLQQEGAWSGEPPDGEPSAAAPLAPHVRGTIVVR